MITRNSKSVVFLFLFCAAAASFAPPSQFVSRGSTPVNKQKQKRQQFQLNAAHDNQKLRRLLLGGMSAVGAMETAFLTASKYTTTPLSLCGAEGACNSVLNSSYAHVPWTTIPLSAVGVIAYAVVALLAMQQQEDDERNNIYLVSMTTAMAAFSIVLMTLLVTVLHATCAYCILSALLSVGLAVVSWTSLRANQVNDGMKLSLMTSGAALAMGLAIFVSNGADAAVNPAGLLITSSTTSSAATVLVDNTKGEKPPAITTTSSKEAIKLATKLQALDARFYGAFWCSHCYEQKQALGKEAMAKIPYTECSKDGYNAQTKLCKDKKLPGYPTWEIRGKLYAGEQALSELEEIVNEAMKEDKPLT
jgi:uncharacterized membrane protein